MITLIGAVGLILLAAIIVDGFQQSNDSSNRSAPVPTSPQSRSIIEDFKRNARRIGGSAFPAPKIENSKIAREPAASFSTYLNPAPRSKDNQPTFMMHRPLVEDITTISSGNKSITLAGIVPLPVDTKCELEGEIRPCGRLARTALRALIRGRTLKCNKISQLTKVSTLVTSCKVGNVDLAGWLIKQGWTTPLERSQVQTE